MVEESSNHPQPFTGEQLSLLISLLLEVKLPHDPVCPCLGLLVCHYFPKGREVNVYALIGEFVLFAVIVQKGFRSTHIAGKR